MKNTFGEQLSITLFGESHGTAIGAVIDGIASGIEVDEDFIRSQLSLRRPVNKLSTPRQETDLFEIVSGVYNGYTTGTPICIIIPNGDTRSADYDRFKTTPRPSHADYTALCRYNGFSDPRGGGHFSGRITAAIVASAAIVIPALKKKGITVATHISSIADIRDRQFEDFNADCEKLNKSEFAVLDVEMGEKMKEVIIKASAEGDSVGGVLETAVVGLPAGVGEPWFDTLEGVLAKALFSIPAVKGVEFGAGFKLCSMRGSEANDAFAVSDGKIITKTNNSGGINGGISNGMPIIFRCAVKPTPTISLEQETVDIGKMENTMLAGGGRHDPCIVHRARVVVDSITALALCDMLAVKYGTDWLAR